MRYPNIQAGIFLARPNRFIAHVELGGERVICHVKNTGRCKELLIPGAAVYLTASDNPARKTKYDLVAVEKTPSVGCADSSLGEGAKDSAADTERGGIRLINMDSQAPNRVFGEWAAAGGFVPGLTLLRPETVFGKSRFDFYWEAGTRRGFVEVKGVTLEEGGGAYFPDAPTERGVKHLEELMAARRMGYEACICFVIQMADVDFFAPNDVTHPAFGAALRRAAAAGVRVLVRDCRVTPDSLVLGGEVEARL